MEGKLSFRAPKLSVSHDKTDNCERKHNEREDNTRIVLYAGLSHWRPGGRADPQIHTHTHTRFRKGEGSPFPVAKFALATLSVGMVRDQLH